MKIHIEGMGILGCLLAWKLYQKGVSFTWNDIKAPINAWQASTGCIYPSGDPTDIQNYDLWLSNYFGVSSAFEIATYCFLSKNPPHKGNYQFQRIKKFGVASLPSIHFNAQDFVPMVRQLFRLKEATQPKHSQLIVAHGFNERVGKYLWGWTVKVCIKYPKLPIVLGSRHCLYMRIGRFELDYAYPVPGTGWWYAGSSLISQQVPKELKILSKFETWRTRVEKHGVRVTEVGKGLQGWRPVPKQNETELLKDIGGRWIMKPLWHSGIRHAPMMVEEVLKRL